MSNQSSDNSPVNPNSPCNSARHFLTCPWPLEDQRAGGIDSVFLAECRKAEAAGIDLTVFTTDSEKVRRGSVTIDPWKEGSFFPEGIFNAWFENGEWPVIHQGGFTAPHLQEEILREMYSAAESTHDLGSVARLFEHSERFYPASNPPELFNAFFRENFERVPAGRDVSVHFQDFFFAPSMREHAPRLRQQGNFVTFHHHEVLHPDLIESQVGRRFLESMMACNVVFVHTDRFRRVLEPQLERIAKESNQDAPLVKRFDLGIDTEAWDRMLGQVTPQNYRAAIPDFVALKPRQKAFVEEVLSSQATIPHRFACFDRVDPNKGTHAVLDGIREFLQSEIYSGKTIADLRKNFRFFGAHDLIFLDTFDPNYLKSQYVKVVKEKYEALQRDFPGVVFVSEPFIGKQRSAVASMMLGCHCLAGGGDDGLGLATVENIYVNHRASQRRDVNINPDTTLIVGQGAGFAIQTIDNGNGHLGLFPKAGDGSGFAEAIREAARRQRDEPGRLRAEIDKLVRLEVLTRNASVIVRPE